MCSECKKQFCPDACPQSDTRAFTVCEDCGIVLDGCVAYLGHDGNHYCIDCIEGMDTDELLRICGVRSISELLVRIEANTRGKEGMFFISAND